MAGGLLTKSGNWRSASIEVDPYTGWLVQADCSCEEFARNARLVGEWPAHPAGLDGVPACRHVRQLLAGATATRAAVALAEPVPA